LRRSKAKKENPEYYEKGLALFPGGLIAGVDEVGRGPLAGPVVAAAVVFPPGVFIQGVTDSKGLRQKEREALFPVIKKEALAVGFGLVWPEEIDRTDILRASLKAMSGAVSRLGLTPDLVLVDGNQPLPGIGSQQCLVRGDRSSHAIGAASVLAKVVRDKLMESWHFRFPQYNFYSNKGYGTREHLEALKRFGPCPLHRLSFRGTVIHEGFGWA
jgi:ribonuclease HII